MTMLSIIIVNWNSYELLCDCLRSIYRDIPPFRFEIIVVDNSTTEDEVKIIRDKFPSVHLIENHSNRGFGTACNQGATEAKGKYFLFLNPDTCMHPGTLSNAVSFMDTHPETGAMGCRTLNADGSLQNTAFTFPTPARIFASVSGLNDRLRFLRLWSRLKRRVDFVQGAFLMIPGELFWQIRGFDERFFLFGEDVDLCLRIRRAGRKISYNPQIVITHIRGGCFNDTTLRTAHFITGCLQLYRKYRENAQVKRLEYLIRVALKIYYSGSKISKVKDASGHSEYRRFRELFESIQKKELL